MPFNRPTLSENQALVQQDIEGRLGSGPLLKRSVLYVFSQVIAGAVHSLYGFLDWLSRQFFLDTAEAEYIAREASIYGITRADPRHARGEAVFMGSDARVILEGLRLKRPDGLEYITLDSAVIVDGRAVLTVEAVNAGVIGNVLADQTLMLVNPLAGVSSQVRVGALGITGGRDLEDDSSLRARIVRRKQAPPHGGAAYDYETWALAVPGITRAYPYAQGSGPGTVDVVLIDDTRVPPVPEDAVIQAVQVYFDRLDIRPITADVAAVPVMPHVVNFQVAITPDTPVVREAVRASLEDLFRRDSAPGKAVLLSRMREAVSVAAGEVDNTILLPANNAVPDGRAMPVMGDIEWV